MFTSSVTDQNSDYKWAVGYHVGSFQYFGDYGSEIFDFSPFRLFKKFGVSWYINPNFDVELAGQWGHTVYLDDNLEKNLFHVRIKGLNGLLSYKFLSDKNFRPYIKTGLGITSYQLYNNEPGQESKDFSVPVGLGFDYEFSKIKKVSFKVLDNVVAAMKDNPTYKLQINDHTDNVGDDAKNPKLTRDRAKSGLD